MIAVLERPIRWLAGQSSQPWRPYIPGKPTSWVPDIAMLVMLAVITYLLVSPSALVHFDVDLRDFVMEHRPEWLRWVFLTLVWSGQGGVLGGTALVLAGLMSYRYTTVRPLLAWVAAYFMMGLLAPYKWITDRPAPRCRMPSEQTGYSDCSSVGDYVDAFHATLFSGLETADSFPSGHAVNTIVWCGIIVLCTGYLLRPWMRKAILLTPPILAYISMIGLHYHWFWDIPAGLLFGGIIIRIVYRVPWTTIPLPAILEPERKYQ